MTVLLENHKKTPLETFREQSFGSWVQLQNGDYARYHIFGKKGPLHIQFEGLGQQIEQKPKSKITQAQRKTGRVLIIDLEGQGLREVHQRLQRMSNGLNPTRKIDYQKNVRMTVEAISLIMEKEGLSPSEIKAWSGHSFGGMTLSGVAKALGSEHKPPLLQMLTPGVANFNHRFVSSLSNTSLNMMGTWFTLFTLDPDALVIREAIKRFSADPLFQSMANDPVRMEAATALTLGASRVDTVKDPIEYPQGTQLQIFSGENDTTVFSMMHWELGKASLEAGVPTTLIMVEKAGHYLPQDLTLSQQQAVNLLTNAPEEYSGFFYLKRNGKLEKMTEPQALLLYKKSSRKAWEEQKDFITSVFSAMGQTASYPSEWL